MKKSEDDAEEFVKFPRHKLEQMSKNMTELVARLRELTERRQSMFRALLDTEAIRPGAIFEVVESFSCVLYDESNPMKRTKKILEEGSIILFLGYQRTEKFHAYRWLIDEQTCVVESDNISEFVILVKNGSSENE